MNFPAYPPRQESSLLRCIETRSNDADTPSTWRFTLQNLRTGGQMGFRDLAALLAHLQAELPEVGDGSQPDAQP